MHSKRREPLDVVILVLLLGTWALCLARQRK